MSISPVHGTSGDSKKQRFFADFHQQWSSLIGRYNWYDFTLIKVQGEFAPYSGRWELELALLGLGMRLTYIYDHSFNEEMTGFAASLKSELSARTGATEVLDPLGVLDDLEKRSSDNG